MTMQLIKLDEEGICDYYKKRFADFDKNMKNELYKILNKDFLKTEIDPLSLKESKFEEIFQNRTKELRDSISIINNLTDKRLFEYDSYNEYLLSNKKKKDFNNSVEYLINGKFKCEGKSIPNGLLDIEIDRINHSIDVDNKKGFIHDLDNHLIYSTYDKNTNFFLILNKGFEKSFIDFRYNNEMKINKFFNRGFETYLCNAFTEMEFKQNERMNYYYNHAFPEIEKKLLKDVLNGVITHEKIIKRRTI